MERKSKVPYKLKILSVEKYIKWLTYVAHLN